MGNVGVFLFGLMFKLVFIGGKFEVWIKLLIVIKGYLGDFEKIVEVFDDEGFYCLGDVLCFVDFDDFVKGFFFDGWIVENFKLNIGIWVVVGLVCVKLVDVMGGLICDVVIVGENEL